jgi:hypothetical protein
MRGSRQVAQFTESQTRASIMGCDRGGVAVRALQRAQLIYSALIILSSAARSQYGMESAHSQIAVLTCVTHHLQVRLLMNKDF